MSNPSLIAYLDDEPVITLRMLAEMEAIKAREARTAFFALHSVLVESQDYIRMSWKDRHLIKFLVTSSGRVSPAPVILTRKYLPPKSASVYLITRSGHRILREYIWSRARLRYARPRKSGYIYIIQEWLTGHIKIGVSNNPVKRIKGMQTGNSSKLRILSTIEVHDPYKVEKSIHRELSEHKIRGEWFAPEVKTLIHTVIEKAASPYRLQPE